jgi:SAM-dependent methyltransferase
MPRAHPGPMPPTPAPIPAATPAYGRDAGRYDARTRGFQRYRHRVVDRLPLQPGDVVLDVGCGTGLCFPLLRERVGDTGTVVGVEPSAEMRALAAQRVAGHGWTNVRLIGSPVETAALPGADHALFCAVHDVLQSAAALDHVLAHVREGGGVAAAGGKWAAPWAVGLNATVMALHAPFVQDFTGFSRPWALLAERVPGLSVDEVALGGGYVAAGRVHA